MEPKTFSAKSIGIKYGIVATIVFIVIFLLVQALDLNNPDFRFINYVALAVCIALAYNEARKIIHKHRISYLPGLGLGVLITGITAVLYAIFMLIYCNIINTDFINEVRPRLPFQDYLNAPMLASAAFGETLVFGSIASFVLMQFFKRNRSSEFEAEEEASEHNRPDSKDPNVQ